jgi:hypothetical protein
MAHRSEKHPTLPIVMRTYDSTFALQAADSETVREDEKLINAQPKPTYYLADLREVTMSFEEIMKASNMAASQSKTYTNPNVIESLVIVPNRILEMVVKGLNSPVYGNLKIRAFRTPEEAIAYVEQKIKDA